MILIKEKVNSNKNILSTSLAFIVGLSLICAGAFYEWLSCMISLLLIVWLFLKIKVDGRLAFRAGFTSVSCALIVTGYLLSVFWAVDRGMAFVGFLKFLPLPLFLICVYSENRAVPYIKNTIPVLAAVMVAATAVLMQIPPLKDYFSVAERLSGTFQYPNTFALFLLVAELLAFGLQIKKHFKAIIFALLIFGILYTGSRTVLVLAAVANIVVIICSVRFSKKSALISIIAFVAVIAVAGGLAFYGISPFDRLLKINFTSSTFVGRMLYFKDALPVILKHPFGLGYLGYFYTQTTFQTGIYSVKYIHNDILQLCLDIGWIPAVGLTASVVKSLFSRGVLLTDRIILAVMFLHILFDFDLQFIAVFMLLFLFMKKDGGKEITINRNSFSFSAALAVFAAVSLYFSVALGLYSFGATNAADAMYSLNTDNKIKMLISLKRTDGFEEVADSILDRNPYVYIAYGEKARAAYKDGDFGELIKYKNLVFEYAPLVYDEYEEYCYMLINGVTLYDEASDTHSAELCKKQLLATKEKFDENFKKIGKLGKMIKDKPQTRFPDDIEDYIKKLDKEGI